MSKQTDLTFKEKLIHIQKELKAPKKQFNSFGRYNYRSLEDILESLKPHLSKHGLVLTLSDAISECAGILFVETTVHLTDGNETLTAKSSAGIDVNKKGMDYAQAFGASSSYARKYALNGMFLIDDTKDADATNTHGQSNNPPSKKQHCAGVATDRGQLPEPTSAQITAMKKYVIDGRKQEVYKALERYTVSEKLREEILSAGEK